MMKNYGGIILRHKIVAVAHNDTPVCVREVVQGTKKRTEITAISNADEELVTRELSRAIIDIKHGNYGAIDTILGKVEATRNDYLGSLKDKLQIFSAVLQSEGGRITESVYKYISDADLPLVECLYISDLYLFKNDDISAIAVLEYGADLDMPEPSSRYRVFSKLFDLYRKHDLVKAIESYKKFLDLAPRSVQDAIKRVTC